MTPKLTFPRSDLHWNGSTTSPRVRLALDARAEIHFSELAIAGTMARAFSVFWLD